MSTAAAPVNVTGSRASSWNTRRRMLDGAPDSRRDKSINVTNVGAAKS
jgi:hypothetical protein